MLVSNERTVSRANAYRLLADCYQAPERLEVRNLEWLASIAELLHPEGGQSAWAMAEAFQQADAEREELRVAHAKLFIGPFDLLAPPFGSVYLDEERRVMGDSTMDAVGFYAKAGLDPNGEFHEPPDHITTELEFMYYLGYQQMTTCDPKYLDFQGQFLAHHLARWVPSFSQRILASNLHPFYNQLALLTSLFIQGEAAEFGLSPASPGPAA